MAWKVIELGSASNHARMFSNVSHPVASSAYHTWLQSGCRNLSRGTRAMAYIAIASGQPCVVPSCDENACRCSVSIDEHKFHRRTCVLDVPKRNSSVNLLKALSASLARYRHCHLELRTLAWHESLPRHQLADQRTVAVNRPLSELPLL